MVRRALRSKSYRRIKTRTPGGTIVTHFKKKRPNKAHCSRCGDVLKGVASDRPAKMKKIPKTMKRPERPFGGELCSKCSRSLFKEKAKSLE
jgi:large subunit ribosomal protein L34e